MGCDATSRLAIVPKEEFQFTHPVWGATMVQMVDEDEKGRFQFTLPVWGATV